MNGDIREPEPADDDIPVLTDIVVPGRLQPAKREATDATPDFVFDIDFERDQRGASTPTEAQPAGPLDDSVAAPGPDLDLPLPWTEPEPAPGLPSEPAPPSATRSSAAEPLIVAAVAKAAAAAIEPPDADAQALLRELLAEIGQGLERRLAQEMAQTEQRLRAALREELDARLRELLAGTPPTA